MQKAIDLIVDAETFDDILLVFEQLIDYSSPEFNAFTPVLADKIIQLFKNFPSISSGSQWNNPYFLFPDNVDEIKKIIEEKKKALPLPYMPRRESMLKLNWHNEPNAISNLVFFLILVHHNKDDSDINYAKAALYLFRDMCNVWGFDAVSFLRDWSYEFFEEIALQRAKLLRWLLSHPFELSPIQKQWVDEIEDLLFME